LIALFSRPKILGVPIELEILAVSALGDVEKQVDALFWVAFNPMARLNPMRVAKVMAEHDLVSASKGTIRQALAQGDPHEKIIDQLIAAYLTPSKDLEDKDTG
jgi:hypothetical protein